MLKLNDISAWTNTFDNEFKATPVIAFNKNSLLRQNATTGECIPYNTSPCLSCQQIRATTTFESTQTK